MTRDTQIEQALCDINDLVDSIDELLLDMPIKSIVRNMMSKQLADWVEELTDATTLSPTDW